jgi:hypothetical protein
VQAELRVSESSMHHEHSLDLVQCATLHFHELNRQQAMHPRLRGVCFKWRCGNTFGFLIQPPFSLTKKINYTAKVWHNWCDVIILSNRAQLQESSCRRMTLLYAVSRAVKLRICAKLPHVEYMLTSATWIPLSDSQVLCK